MKKLFTTLFTILAMVNISAQTNELKDLIYTSDNKVVEAKVIEVSSQEVRYKDWNNQNGPMFILTAAEVKKIEFSNGTVKTFSSATPTSMPTSTPTTQTNIQTKSAEKVPVSFQFNADVEGNLAFINSYYVNGYQVSNYAVGGVSALLGLGTRIDKFLYTGVASGIHCEWGNTTVRYGSDSYSASAAAYVVPIFADIRAYAPTHGNCYPFAEIGIGGYVGVNGSLSFNNQSEPNKPEGGFYFVSGAGLEFKCLTLGIGYKLLRNADFIGNHAYVKVGVSLGGTQKVKR